MIAVTNLSYHLPNKRKILTKLNFELPKGSFLTVLGENGAGKTSLLDILMGFRLRTGGTVMVMEKDPGADHWEARSRIAYLSEKVDMPGDWEAREYLEFFRKFYSHYDLAEEKELMSLLSMKYGDRVGNLSAGEIRRLQIVGALAAQPELIIADEITAVLDILGRRNFLKLLQSRQQDRNLTIVLATNVPEGLESYADHVLFIQKGQQIAFETTQDFMSGDLNLAEAVIRRLDPS